MNERLGERVSEWEHDNRKKTIKNRSYAIFLVVFIFDLCIDVSLISLERRKKIPFHVFFVRFFVFIDFRYINTNRTQLSDFFIIKGIFSASICYFFLSIIVLLICVNWRWNWNMGFMVFVVTKIEMRRNGNRNLSSLCIVCFFFFWLPRTI